MGCNQERQKNHNLAYATWKAIQSLNTIACTSFNHVQHKSIDIWHQRLGHLSLDGVETDENTPYEKNCESCALGKMHRQSFPKRDSYSASQPLEIIHIDICSPMWVESMGGSCYILMFTDDYARCTTVYFLKGKDQALSKFKEYANLVEKQTGLGKGHVK